MEKFAMRKILSLLTTVGLCTSFLTACGGTPSTKAPESGDSSAPASAVQPTGDVVSTKDKIIIVVNSEIQSVDPADQAQLGTSQLIVQFAESLMYLDEEYAPKPLLAESITQVDDITYEVKLKKGIMFQNGEEMKASDVVFSFQRALENTKTYTNLGDIDPEGFEIIDDYTLTMKTKAPVATFYATIAHAQASIISEKGVTDLGDKFGTEAQGVGTGPYEFVKWTPGVEVILEAYDGYWGSKAKIKRIEWKFVEDANSRTVMLEVGEADIIYSVPTAGIEALEANPDTVVQSITSTTVRFLYMNQSSGLPLENKELRQAICYAINRDALVKNVFGEYATPATSYVSDGVIGHTDDVEQYTYDVEKAKAKLQEAGYAPGELNIKLSMWSQNLQYSMAEIIQANLADIGINMEIEGLEASAWVAALAEGKTDMGFNTNSNVRADPDSLYTPVFSGNIPAPNHGCVNDPKMDELVIAGRRTSDPAEREKIYVEAQQIAAKEAYYYPICYDNITMASRADLQNFVVSLTSMNRFNICYFA